MKKVTKGKEKSIKKLKKEAAKSTLDAASNAILDHPEASFSLLFCFGVKRGLSGVLLLCWLY